MILQQNESNLHLEFYFPCKHHLMWENGLLSLVFVIKDKSNLCDLHSHAAADIVVVLRFDNHNDKA